MKRLTGTLFKRVFQAGIACAALGTVIFAAAPAEAQGYYGPPRGYYGPPPGYYHRHHRPPPYGYYNRHRYWSHGRWFYRPY